MDRALDHELIQEIEAYLAKTGMKPWEFGRKALNDPALWDDLRTGRELRRGTRERVRAYIAQPIQSGEAA